MGICMGVTFTAPPPATFYDLEYEEPELAKGGRVTKGYIKRRQAEGYQFWGAKTPRLLEQWDRLDGYKIVTRRPMEDVTASVRRVFGENSWLEDWHSRLPLDTIDADLVIDFGTDPYVIAEKIGALVGIEYCPDLAVLGIRL